MKKLLLVLSSAAILSAISCTEELPTPEIKAEQNYEAGYEAAEHSIAYIIENPTEGEKLSAESGAEWIEIISTDNDKVTFNVSENKDESERTASIVLSYIKATDIVINVRQAGKEAINLSENGTANCYMVPEAGKYYFQAVKGNGTESVGQAASVEVLWESFGTDSAPEAGELISNVELKDNKIVIETGETYKKGNAVIAVRDSNGDILWSWHIWLTDIPADQICNNDAGTQMDRNLGATSANPGDVAALGLLYQWGRKDPFLGSSSISEAKATASTISWPEAVMSDPTTGTIEYVTKNPTTFILSNSNNFEWYYQEVNVTDDTRWMSEKTIYDPCPAGYRVPDGGDTGFWCTAFWSQYFEGEFDGEKKGINFGGDFLPNLTEEPVSWYPAMGFINPDTYKLTAVGEIGNYWSCTPDATYGYGLSFYYQYVQPKTSINRGYGHAIRCVKE